MGLTIKRIPPGEKVKTMSKVLLSAKRYYVNADKTQAVETGDPSAAFLLVGKGSIIEPQVARFYGVETYEGEAISKMPFDAEAERKGMVTQGIGTGAAERYDNMSREREIRNAIKAQIPIIHPQYGRQAEFMAQGIINRMRAEDEERGTYDPTRQKDESEAEEVQTKRTKTVGVSNLASSPENETTGEGNKTDAPPSQPNPNPVNPDLKKNEEEGEGKTENS